MTVNRRLFLKATLTYGITAAFFAGKAYGGCLDSLSKCAQPENQSGPITYNDNVIRLTHDNIEIVTNNSYYKNREAGSNIDIYYDRNQIAIARGLDMYMTQNGYKFFEKVDNNFFVRKIPNIEQSFVLFIDDAVFDFQNSIFVTDNNDKIHSLYDFAHAANARAYDQLHYNSSGKIWTEAPMITYW